MKDNAVTNIWKEFLLILEEQGIVDKIDTDNIMDIFIEDKIDPIKLAANIQVLTHGDDKIDNKYKPTKSLSYIISNIDKPEGSPLWFLAAYPDVIVWFNIQKKEYMKAHGGDFEGRSAKITERFNIDSMDDKYRAEHKKYPGSQLYRNLINHYKKVTGQKSEVAVEEGSENDFYLGYEVLNASGYNNVVEMIAEFTTKYYLELNTRYKDEFEEESYLLATAGILDALPYVHDTKTISPLEIRDMARDVVKHNAKKSSPKDSLVDFIIKLAAKIMEIDTPDMDVLEIENACTEQKELIKKTVQKVKKNYTSEEVFASRTDIFMRDMKFKLYREVLGVKAIYKEDPEAKSEPKPKENEGIPQKKEGKFFKEIRLALRWASVLILIWGIITLDRFRIIFGIILGLGCFLFYYIKQRKHLRDNLVYTGYKIISDIKNSTGIHVIEENNYGSICLLFYIGLIIGVSDQLSMRDDQTLSLANAILLDLEVTIKDKNTQLLTIMRETVNNEENAKVVAFGIGISGLFVRLGKSAITDTKDSLLNDFGTVNFKL